MQSVDLIRSMRKDHAGSPLVAGYGDVALLAEFHDGIGILLRTRSFNLCFHCVVVNSVDLLDRALMVMPMEHGQNLAAFLEYSAHFVPIGHEDIPFAVEALMQKNNHRSGCFGEIPF